MIHCTEEELIAWQLGEAAGADRVRAHVEMCETCAQEAGAIARTLRIFSAAPVPQVHLDHAWHRLRGSLPALHTAARPARWRVWMWAGPALTASVLAGWVALHHMPPRRPNTVAADVVLHGPGPVTAEPSIPADATPTEHLASAERLLTEISHTGGTLDASTREQAHLLLLSNAVYVQKAQQHGDTPEAAVLEDLGRTLTVLAHEQDAQNKDRGWHMRLEVNTQGLLLDLRILQQNDRTDARAQAEPSSAQEREKP